jgi:hypothetical protein
MAVKQSLAKITRLSPWSVAIGSMFILLLAACGGDSGSNGKQEETSTENKVDSLPKVETFDDLPNCSKSREDSIMVTSDENVAYRCIKGRWETLGEPYEIEDDLPNCSSNREGLRVYVLDGKSVFVCEEDGIWDEIPHGETFDRSSDDEDAIIEENENSGKDGTENGNSEDDDGENNDGDGGSSNSVDNGDDDIIQSASSEQTTQTACGEVAYTTTVAGPLTVYGYFGYVLPLKVTTGKTQELYLAFNTPITHINGPKDWNKFSALIAQYNSKDSVWVQGTEIFSNDEKNATPKFTDSGCPECATVNTYGRFEKFEFNIKGTWLEKYAGKTVDVVVNFYAPAIESESSGMGLDYYSIPGEEDFSRDGLFYSEKEPDCSFIGSPIVSCDNAYTNNYKPIIKGDTVRWTITKASYRWSTVQFDISNYSVESLAGKVVKENLGFVSYVDVVYDKQGTFKERLILNYNDGVSEGIKGECYNSVGWYPSGSHDSIEVVSDVNNCTCAASSESLDGTTAGSFTLTAKSCTSESPIVDYSFGNMICRETTSGTSCADYEFSDAISVSESSISVNYAAGTRTVYNPFVTVTNRDGVSSRIACPTIEVQPSNSSTGISNSVISPNSGVIRIPKGTWPVEFLIPNWSMCHVALGCTTSGFPAENSEIEMILDGKTITDVVPSGSYKEIDLTEKLVCPSSTAGTITVSKDVSCSLTGW